MASQPFTVSEVTAEENQNQEQKGAFEIRMHYIIPKTGWNKLAHFARAFVFSKNVELMEEFGNLLESEEALDKLEEVFQEWKFKYVFPEIHTFLYRAKGNGTPLELEEEWIKAVHECFNLRRLIALKSIKFEDEEMKESMTIGLDHPIVFTDLNHVYIGLWQQRKGLPFQWVKKLKDAQRALKKLPSDLRDLGKRYSKLYTQLGI